MVEKETVHYGPSTFKKKKKRKKKLKPINYSFTIILELPGFSVINVNNLFIESYEVPFIGSIVSKSGLVFHHI